MVSEKDFKYYVVELTESPIANSYKYVCIPSSWIKYQEITGGEVIIKYPIEKKSVTKKRIKKREESADHWQIHSVDIKLGTNSYKEATNYIKILNKISKQDETEIMVDGVPLKLGRTCEANVQTISTLLSDNVEPMSNKKSEQVSNQTSLTASKDECQEEIKVGDSSSKIKRYFTRRTNKMSSSTVSVDQTEKNNTPETSTCGKEIVKSSQKDDSSVKSCQVITDNFILREALRKVLGNNYKEKVGMIYDDYKSRYEIFKLLCDDSLQHCKIWKALMDEILDDDNNGQEANSRTNKKVIWSDIRNNNDDMDETVKDNNNSEDNKSSDKIRGQARKFTLPPEYDPEDSKWTLKHREYKEGLVELIPNSQIYIDAIELSNCKRMSKDSKTLARMLLLEVFRHSALSICSLTGKKANAFDLSETRVRPGLDEYARNVLLNFVEQHATEQKWVYWNRPSILNSLRNKMQDMRGKYG